VKNQCENLIDTRRKACTVKRMLHKTIKPITHFVATIWAIGVGVVATMVSPLLIHWWEVQSAPPRFYLGSGIQAAN